MSDDPRDPDREPLERGPLGAEHPFARLRAAFEELADLAPEEREVALGRLRATDPGLAGEVRSLLDAAERTSSPLDAPLLRPSERSGARFPEGEEIPGFHLLRPIGRGGTATVYLAEQQGEGFTRRVALKVVDRGPDARLARRFHAEQGILAALEHAGIARLYDSGIALSGRPYLAMELVEGENIFDFCRQRKLALRARLELFLKVLDAIAYAHGAGVVHRDLKPANILVTESGEPKLLDFGISRLQSPAPGVPEAPTDPELETTHTLHRAMTPAYASPEQVGGEAIDARSDLYSLGVVLYELLTERRPYRLTDSSHQTLARAIREQEPERPSSALAGAEESKGTGTKKGSPAGAHGSDRARLCRALRGDLDAILLKALRKEAGARYASASDFAADLRRHLEGRPVLARRGTLLYRTGRFLRRRRGLLVQGVLALLLAGAAGLWIVERQAARRAARLDQSPGASPWLALPMRSSAEESYRKGLAARSRLESVEAVRQMREAAEADPKNPLVRAALADVLALGDRIAAAKAEGERALALAPAGGLPRESRLLVESVALRAGGRSAAEAKVLRSLWLLRPENLEIGLLFGRSLARSGETQEAQDVVKRLRALPQPAGGDLRIALLELGLYGDMGKMRELLARVAPVKAEAERRGLTLVTAWALLQESNAHDGLGESPQTRALAEQAKGIFRKHGEVGGVARSDHMLCLASLRENDHEQVEKECGEGLRLHRSLSNPGGVSKVLNLLGASRRRRGLLVEARGTFQEALAAGRGLGDRLTESRLLFNIANVDLELGRLLDAETEFRQVIPIKREIRDQRGLLMALKTQAEILMKRGVLREVEPILAEAESVGRELGGSRELAGVLWTRGDFAALGGDRKRAFAAWQEAGKIYERAGEADSVAEIRFVLAEHAEPYDATVCRALEGAARDLEVLGDEDVVSASLSASRCWNEVGSPRRASPWIERAAKHPILERSAPARIDLAMTRGVDAMARRQWAEAERWLGEAAAESRNLSYGALVLETRLLQLQLSRARGDHPERVRTLAEELTRDARAAGFGDFSRRAEEIGRAPRLARSGDTPKPVGGAEPKL